MGIGAVVHIDTGVDLQDQAIDIRQTVALVVEVDSEDCALSTGVFGSTDDSPRL